MEILAENKRAYYDYEILETFEAGLELLGTEVKSIKNKKISLNGAYVVIRGGEAYLLNSEIHSYQANNTPFGYDPKRTRKLLLKQREISYLLSKISQKGLTLIPLKVYNKRGLIKLEFALAKGKHLFDKREKIKKREFKRKIERFIKEQF